MKEIYLNLINRVQQFNISQFFILNLFFLNNIYTSFPISQIAFIASMPTAGAINIDKLIETP